MDRKRRIFRENFGDYCFLRTKLLIWKSSTGFRLDQSSQHQNLGLVLSTQAGFVTVTTPLSPHVSGASFHCRVCKDSPLKNPGQIDLFWVSREWCHLCKSCSTKVFGKNPRDEGKVKRGLVLLCVTTTAKELGEKFLLNKRELDFGTDPTGESGVEGLDVPWMNFHGWRRGHRVKEWRGLMSHSCCSEQEWKE